MDLSRLFHSIITEGKRFFEEIAFKMKNKYISRRPRKVMRRLILKKYCRKCRVYEINASAEKILNLVLVNFFL